MCTYNIQILTELTLKPKCFRNLIHADHWGVSDSTKNVGEDAGGLCPVEEMEYIEVTHTTTNQPVV